MYRVNQRIVAIMILLQMFLCNGMAAEQLNDQVLQEHIVYCGLDEWGWPCHHHYYFTEDVLIDVLESCDNAEVCSKCGHYNEYYNSGVIYYSYYEPCYSEVYDNIDYNYLEGEEY